MNALAPTKFVTTPSYRPVYRRSVTTMAAKVAKWNNKVIAESDATVVVEGNHVSPDPSGSCRLINLERSCKWNLRGAQYFPPDALKKEYFADSSQTTTCGWKGVANYYDVVVDGQVSRSTLDHIGRALDDLMLEDLMS